MKLRLFVLAGLGVLALVGAALRAPQPAVDSASEPPRDPPAVAAETSEWKPPPPSDPEALSWMQELESTFRQMPRLVRLQIDTRRPSPNIGQPDSVEIWGVVDGGEIETSMLFVFSGPQMLRGTGLLLEDRWQNQEDTMWYHMRSFHRFKQLPRSSLRRLVAGTCLTYEDARGFFSTDKYEFHFAEPPGAGATRHLLATPKTAELAADLGYRQMRLTLDPERLLVLAVEYLDAAGQRAKTYETHASTSLGPLFLPTEAAMEDLETRRSSQLRYAYWLLPEPPPRNLFVTRLEGRSLLELFADSLQGLDLPAAAEALRAAPENSEPTPTRR